MEKVVLMVDDETVSGEYLMRALPKEIAVFLAQNFTDAKRIFLERKPTHVILDGCVEKKTIDSLPFLAWLKEQGFTGKIIAYSAGYNQALLQAGATHCAHKYRIKELVELVMD